MSQERFPDPYEDLQSLRQALSNLRKLDPTDEQLNEIVQAERMAGAIGGVLKAPEVRAAIEAGAGTAARVLPGAQQLLDLDQYRPYPIEAAEQLGKLWAGIAAEYTPPPSDRGYLDCFQADHLPAPVCRGTTPEGRRFIAITLRTFHANGEPEDDGPVVGVAHERYVNFHDKWVWAGTSCGSLQGHADPELVAALIGGRGVRLRGGGADGYRLVPAGALA